MENRRRATDYWRRPWLSLGPESWVTRTALLHYWGDGDDLGREGLDNDAFHAWPDTHAGTVEEDDDDDNDGGGGGGSNSSPEAVQQLQQQIRSFKRVFTAFVMCPSKSFDEFMCLLSLVEIELSVSKISFISFNTNIRFYSTRQTTECLSNFADPSLFFLCLERALKSNVNSLSASPLKGLSRSYVLLIS